MNYFKILVFLQKGDKKDYETPVEGQRNFLQTLKEPRNDVERGFRQYQCQNYFVSRWKIIAFNISSIFPLLFVTLYYLLKRVFVHLDFQLNAMIEDKGMEEVVPDIVLNKYNPISEYWAEGSSLCLSDILFIFKLVYCAPLHPFFVFKAMMNIARYSDMIKRHKPKTMIQFGEFSFSSSILTAYCHKKGVRHIDVMHGEKVYCIKDAFFHYDECYVWDDYYVTLFISLRAEASQFRIALPPSIKIECEKYLRSDAYADYKYYLGLYSEDEIKSIVFSMQFAKREGKTVKYRIHPRYSDVNLLKKYVQESEIEYPKDVTILESISNLEYAVGLFTTVLTQAYYSGKKVIMDDMTYKELYAKMGSISYILTSKVKDKLSDMQ